MSTCLICFDDLLLNEHFQHSDDVTLSFAQGRAGHRPEGHLLQDPLCADANAIAGI